MKLNLQSDERSSYPRCYTQVMRKRISFRENLPLPREMSWNREPRSVRQRSGDGTLTLPWVQLCLVPLPPSARGPQARSGTQNAAGAEPHLGDVNGGRCEGWDMQEVRIGGQCQPGGRSATRMDQTGAAPGSCSGTGRFFHLV